MQEHRPRRPLFWLGRSIPNLFDYFVIWGGVTRARKGRMGVDWETRRGGFSVWLGPLLLEMDLDTARVRRDRHALAAPHRAAMKAWIAAAIEVEARGEMLRGDIAAAEQSPMLAVAV